FPKIRETWGTPLSINPVGSGRLSRIRMRTGHDGRGMESGLPLFRPKENGSQIWIADFDAARGTVTDKHRLTNIATEADGELWSPDGKTILFKSDVYPDCDGAPAEATPPQPTMVQQDAAEQVAEPNQSPTAPPALHESH